MESTVLIVQRTKASGFALGRSRVLGLPRRPINIPALVRSLGAMAVRLLSRSRSTLVQLPLHRSGFRHVSDGPSDLSDEQTVEDASAFVRWKNGGGLFHRSARIDPTAVVEVGAVVHPDSVLGSDVRIGSGTVVGPSVSIRQSTKVG
ncbi:hypothetical protein GW17_00012238 [Ensete ventricosum]|nr:hypothetical protein GW17_00012238 [Ensete ventricosum]